MKSRTRFVPCRKEGHYAIGGKKPISNEKAKYTPGPWRLENAAVPINPVNGWIVKQDDAIAFPICLISETRGGLRSPQSANAALIAAAPELLEVCQEILEIEMKRVSCNHKSWAARLRAAIAKAEGRTK